MSVRRYSPDNPPELVHAPPDAERVEPWTPEVGQRVRVRLNKECPHWYPELIAGYIGHHDDLEGATGVVMDDDADGVEVKTVVRWDGIYDVEWDWLAPNTSGHVYLVRFDRLIEGYNAGQSHGHFAAAELEPIE